MTRILLSYKKTHASLSCSIPRKTAPPAESRYCNFASDDMVASVSLSPTAHSLSILKIFLKNHRGYSASYEAQFQLEENIARLQCSDAGRRYGNFDPAAR